MLINQSQQPESFRSAQTNQPVLLEKHRLRVEAFIGAEVGIQLPASKHTLIEGRLRKRLRLCGFEQFNEYLDYVLDNDEGRNERLHLIDAITTNKTDFFREDEHFRFLVEQALPAMEKKRSRDGRWELNLWSAGCSSGEEPYTLAMVLNELVEKKRHLCFDILATDISPSCLRTAHRGVYPEARVAPVPMPLRKKYLERCKNPAEKLVRMGLELRRRIHFRRLNFMDKHFDLEQRMDVIFCRNVMIYFNRQFREELTQRFARQLVPGGLLFIGHSESLNGMVTGLEQIAPAIYRKPTLS